MSKMLRYHQPVSHLEHSFLAQLSSQLTELDQCDNPGRRSDCRAIWTLELELIDAQMNLHCDYPFKDNC